MANVIFVVCRLFENESLRAFSTWDEAEDYREEIRHIHKETYIEQVPFG